MKSLENTLKKTLLSQCENVDTGAYTEPEKPFETKKPPRVVQFDFTFSVPETAEQYQEKSADFKESAEFH